MKILPVSEVLRGRLEHQRLTEDCASECASPSLSGDEKQEESKAGNGGFWAAVQKGESEECWPWIGGTDKDGYGRVKFDGKMQRAHRVAVVLVTGETVDGFEVLHTCDNPPCCNPRHLKVGTHAENMADRDGKGRQASGTRNGRAKLTEDTVRSIRAAYVPFKVTARKLAAMFGVNFYIVRDIIGRVTWKGIEPESPTNRGGLVR